MTPDSIEAFFRMLFPGSRYPSVRRRDTLLPDAVEHHRDQAALKRDRRRQRNLDLVVTGGFR